MSTLRKWTEDEEKVVISKIEENPNNLRKAFREVSLEIGRTPAAIEYRWYQGGLRERSGKLFMTYGKKEHSTATERMCQVILLTIL